MGRRGRVYVSQVSAANFTPALDAWLRGEDPLDQPVPLHASYEDKPGAPDRVLAGISPELAARQVESWRCLLVGLRPLAPVVLDYGVAMQGAPESSAGSGRAITRLPALARFAPRPLVLDLADQVSTHLREGLIKVALVGGGHEVRPSRQPGLQGELLVWALGVFQ